MLLKRSLSLFLCTVLMLSLCAFTLPRTAKAAPARVYIATENNNFPACLDANTPYYTNGSSNATNSPEGYNAYYNAATGVLTLKNLNVQGVAYAFNYNSEYDCSVAIYAEGALTIEAIGTNRVSVMGVSGSESKQVVAGVYAEGDLTINGSGSLKIRGSDFSANVNTSSSYGVFAKNSLTVSGCSVSAVAAAITNSFQVFSVSSLGIYANTGVTIHENARVECEGGAISNGNPLFSYTCGAYTLTGGVTVSDGYLCATSGNISAFGGRPNTFGIYAGSSGYESIEIRNSTVIARSVPEQGTAIHVSERNDIQLLAPYKWRIDSLGDFKTNAAETYKWTARQTYVEICPTDPAVTLVYGSGGSVNDATYETAAYNGYVIDKMFVDGAEITAACGQERYTPATLPTRLMFVCFKQTAAAVLVRAGYGGSIGSGPSYAVTANSGYVIDELWVDGAEITDASGQTSYTPTTPPTSSIIATFAYTVNFNTPANGTLTVARGGNPLTSSEIVRGGDALTITAVPNANYVLSSLTVNGRAVTPESNNAYTYTVGTSPADTRMAGNKKVLAQGAQIEAAFAPIGTSVLRFTTQPAAQTTVTAGSITGNLTAAATVTPAGAVQLTWYACDAAGNITGSALATGGTFALPSTLAAGTYYYVCEATATGATAVKSIIATVTVSAIPVTTFTIEATANDAVYGTTSGDGVYASGATVSLSAAANTSCHFVKWTENGVEISTANPYVFTASENRTLVGVFAADTPPVPPVPPTPGNSGGSSSISGGGAYIGNQYAGSLVMGNGGAPMLTVQAPCDKCVSVIVDGVQLTKDKDYTIDCGSTIVTFTPAYLATLANGTHSIRVQFTDGRYDGNFITPFTASLASAPMADVPATGDTPPLARVIEWLRRGGK